MVTIERAAATAPESLGLMAEMCAEIDTLYGNREPSEFSRMDSPGAVFVVAREDGVALGCGAIRPITARTAEVKRIYVRPAARRGGVARKIMAALEEIARAEGFQEAWLETGLRQPAAIRLYEGLGYQPISKFGDYRDDPVSLCFGKKIAGSE